MAAKRRLKIELQALDLKILPLYEQGHGCRIIGKELGEHPALIFKRLKHLGKIRTSEEIQKVIPNRGPEPFTQRKQDLARLRHSAIGMAVEWFSTRGYIPSLPLEPTRYDLIVESDAGLKKIQVKTTTRRSREGRWYVSISHHVYDPQAKINSAGKIKREKYDAGDVDFFFIVTGDGDRYLIPHNIAQTYSITLDVKYAEYKLN